MRHRKDREKYFDNCVGLRRRAGARWREVSQAVRTTERVLAEQARHMPILKRLLGSWNWFLLLNRPAFAIMQPLSMASRLTVFPFLQSMSPRMELRLLLSLARLLRYNLRKPEGDYMRASDVSLTKGAALYTPHIAWHANQTELVTRYSNSMLSRIMCLSDYN